MCNSIIKDGKLSKSESQTNKCITKQIKFCSKEKTRTMLRLNKKNFEDEEFPHVLILTTRETPEMRNAFANNMSADIKLSKSQIPNIIQSVRFLSNKCCYSFS